ncbi:MAG: hypothetical protein ACOH5I_14315 [Oligoflexus sp.]
MSIYFANRSLQDPQYQNEDYLKQQRQFITILKSRADVFSLRVGEVEIEDKEGRKKETGFICIDLRDVSRITVNFPSAQINACVHDLFEIWSQNPEADFHLVHDELKAYNLEEFLGQCHDILTVKFDEDWKRSG